jgi:hypothetical protein
MSSEAICIADSPFGEINYRLMSTVHLTTSKHIVQTLALGVDLFTSNRGASPDIRSRIAIMGHSSLWLRLSRRQGAANDGVIIQRRAANRRLAEYHEIRDTRSLEKDCRPRRETSVLMRNALGIGQSARR